MLYFSKIKILIISLFTIILIYFTLSNFIKTEDSFFNKKINLGLDLQGGSYLLLEVDNEPVVIQKLQNTVSILRKYFKVENIKYQNLSLIDNDSIIFLIDNSQLETVKEEFENKESELNIYYSKYNAHQFNFKIINNQFILKLSKYGLIEIKNSSLDQALEIVRRRIDEVGTNEPNILKRGNDRILVELPGLDDPMRIKKLLGKTANLTFRFIIQGTEETFGSEKNVI